MPDPNHVVDELPALALGVLDEAEAARVSVHLSGCAACQAEWRAYRETMGLLAAVIPPARPPERLKRTLLQRLPQKEAPPSTSILAKIRGFLAHPGPAFSLAGLALIAVLLVSNLYFWQRGNPTSSPTRAGFGTVPLLSVDPGSHTTGMVVYTLDGESGFLVVNHLPALPEGQEYQLWLIQDGLRTSGGVFKIYEDGYGVMRVISPQLLTNFDSFGITIEPAGGSPAPTGDKVLGGSF